MLIKLEGVSKSYGKVVALRDVSLSISEGVAGLIGPNGAGKSTLIKIILGLVKPSEGSVKVFGLDPWVQGEEVRGRIGVLHEKPRFPGWATGREFMKFIAKLKGLAKPAKEAEEMLKLVGLWEFRGMRIDCYSAGMVQRLGIAQAMIGRPELVILDEPTANLDPKAKLEVLETVRKVRAEGKTSFLISTHVLPELEKVCESLVIINEGRIVDEGGLEELSSKYYAHSLTVRVDEPLKFMEWLGSLSYVKDFSLKAGEVTLNTSNLRLLLDEIGKPPGDAFKVIHVTMNPGTLERIYLEATKREV